MEIEAAGWKVCRFERGGDLSRAARGADVIVNAAHPGDYTRWAAEQPALTARVIQAVRVSGATLIQPANVYVFGQTAPERFAADTPHAATNPLGRLRIRMEQDLRDADIPVILLRAGDFLDTEASGNWFDKVMAPSLAKGVLTWPGDPEVPHAWAFLPDVARAALQLAEIRADLPRFADIPFGGHALSGRQMAALAAQVLGRPVRLRRMPWWPIRLLTPVWPLARHLLEMRYLWDKPHRLDDAALRAALPGFRPTDPATALARALAPLAPKPKAPDHGRNRAARAG